MFKNVISLSPKTIFVFDFYIEALYYKQINKLLFTLLYLFVAVMLNQIQDLRKQHPITFCHWNLNGLATHSFGKVSLLQAISVSKNYDIIWLSAAFLDSSIDSSDERITNNKKGEESGFIIKSIFLPVIKRDDLCNLNECLL